MRRKECERDEAFAWEVLKNSVYSTLSMVRPDGTPYATPLNIVGDEVYKTLYFHCAGAGERWELLKDGAPVCVTAVSTATDVYKRQALMVVRLDTPEPAVVISTASA